MGVGSMVMSTSSSITEVDFSRFELDEPLPPLTTNGERGTLEHFVQKGKGKTLRKLVSTGVGETVDLTGTADGVADRMGEMMETVSGDGFLVTSRVLRLNRRYIAEITDGLVPALQRRRLTRSDYRLDHFRDNLREF